MKNKYLYTLAENILHHEENGLSKVRFAKILYFVHKGLVKSNLVNSDELKFIRMPLGPVPVGFKELSEDTNITIVQSKNDSSLLYNTQIYTLIESDIVFNNTYNLKIKNILEGLREFPTSNLVEISHKEPSWIQSFNGVEFYISEEDLRIPFPLLSKTNHKIVTQEMDEQRLQAHLVEGMMNDIVEESTALEYPL